MKDLRWYHILLLTVVFLLICFSPVVFTQSALFGLDFFDLSDKGTIGDTIGGVTAPIVGFLNVLLLWFTLRAQLAFNKDQDKINKEQQKFNDANRILAMESHILHLDESLSYGFTGFGKTLEGHGVSSLRLLVCGPDEDITIVGNELEYIIDRVHIIDIALCSMVDYIGKSSLGAEEKKSTIGMAELYLTYIYGFYSDVTDRNIKWIPAIADLHGEEMGIKTTNGEMSNKTHLYQARIRPTLEFCRNALCV